MEDITFNKSIILVVGGAGFVGSNLSRKLLEFNPQKLIIVDNLLSSEIETIPNSSKISFILGSITDYRVLQQLPDNINFIFHLATYHGNQSSIADPLADHENNTFTTLKLLERIKNFKNLKSLVYASAGCTVAKKTFDSANATTENDPISLYLDSPYQISKIIGEFYGNYYYTKYKTPFIKARFQNVYGPGEILGAGCWRNTTATVWRNVIPTFIWKAINQRSLPVDNGGIATRDFIYIDDIVEGLMKCALLGKAGEVYNLASGLETSIKKIAELINKLTENPSTIDITPPRDWDRSGKRYGDTKKAYKELHFQAETNLENGLIKTINWTKQYYDLIDRCINKHKIFMIDSDL